MNTAIALNKENCLVKDDLQGEKTGWLGSLDLEFSRKNATTVLSRRRHYGPLVVQKPFHPEGPVCHCILIHPPGGIVGGDRLKLTVNNQAKAQTLITTPGATKFYRSDQATAQIEQEFFLQDSVMEWLPQESIAFNQCRVKASTRVHLEGHSKFMAWDFTCLGRPAGGYDFKAGFYHQNFQLFNEGKPVFIERNLFEPGPMLDSAWGLNKAVCSGTFIAYGASDQEKDLARAITLDPSRGLCGVSLIDNILVCRVLSHQAEDAKNHFIQIWQAIRPVMLGHPACLPRIWAT